MNGSVQHGRSRSKVTVYIPSHNYGRFLRQCLQSVADQTLSDWDAILIDDGSSDQTHAEMEAFRCRFPERVQIVRNVQPCGLRTNANIVLEMAEGEYLMRLDADDYLDENALLVLAGHLDRHPEIGLVYPNWTYINETGEYIGQERRKRLWDETHVPDLPAHGACTMVRRRVLKAIGGYDTDLPAQDGHELWLKTLYRHGVASVETPLFFYRQHGNSLSADQTRLLDARRQVKHRIAEAGRGPVRPRVAVIVPVKNTYSQAPNLALSRLAEKPLLDYTLDTIAGDPAYACVLVATDDTRVVAHCQQRGDVQVYLRGGDLSHPSTRFADVVVDALGYLENTLRILPDIVIVLSAHTPLRRPEHIVEAIDTLLLYPVEQVLSTWENHDLQYRHGRDGMQAVNAGAIDEARFEREALYSCNGAIRAMWREQVTSEYFNSGRIGHIVMTRTESLIAKKPEERCWLELLLNSKAQAATGNSP